MTKMKENKKISTRVLSFIEEVYENGETTVTPSTADFNDFETIGILKYYIDVFTVQMIRNHNTTKTATE